MLREIVDRPSSFRSRPEVIALAMEMRAAQQREIGQLNRLLTELDPATSGGP